MKNKMRNRYYLFASLLVLIIFGGLFVAVDRIYGNSAPEFSEMPNNTIVVTSTPVNATPVNENATQLPAPSQLVEKLVASWNERNLIKGQWIYTVYQVTSEVENGVVLPDKNLMDMSYLEEGWYFVGEEGQITQDVVFIKDLKGNILQQSAFKDGVGVNFTFETRDLLDPYYWKADRGILQFLLDAESSGTTTLSRDFEDTNGKYLEVYYTEVFNQPMSMNGVERKVESVSISAVFNRNDGTMLSYSNVWNMADGGKVLVEKNELVMVEYVKEVPSEVAEILESVK